MAWSDYPYENPNLNTYIRPVATELYFAFHERYRIAERIHWNDWVEKPTEEEAEDLIYRRNTVMDTVTVLWNLIEECLERYRDPFYTYNGYDLSNGENFYIFQTWMGIYGGNALGYQKHAGYRRTEIEFLDYYEQVFGEELVYLKDYLRFNYSSGELGELGKTLTLAGIFKDFYSILKNCLNEVVGYQLGSTTYTAGGYGTRRNTINAPLGSTAYELSKGARDDDNRVSIAQAYDEALANFNAGNFYRDDVDTQPMTHWGYQNYFSSQQVRTSGSAIDSPWPQGQANSFQNVVEYGNMLVDYKDSFYDYQDKELFNVHYASDGEEYWDVNLSYVGSENTAHLCPMKIKNVNQWVLDYEFIGNNNVYDFNITTAKTERRYARLGVVGSRININEADALEYYIEDN